MLCRVLLASVSLVFLRWTRRFVTSKPAALNCSATTSTGFSTAATKHSFNRVIRTFLWNEQHPGIFRRRNGQRRLADIFYQGDGFCRATSLKTALFSGKPILLRADLGGTISVLAFLCRPNDALTPRMRVSASRRRLFGDNAVFIAVHHVAEVFVWVVVEQETCRSPRRSRRARNPCASLHRSGRPCDWHR